MKRLEVVGRAVEMRRREQVDAVIAPAEAAREPVDRHHLDGRDADVLEERQLVDRRGPGAFRRESADMELVEDLAFQAYAFPPAVAPGIGVCIDDLRRAVRSLRLTARSRIRISRHVVVETEVVAGAGPRRGDES